MNPYYLLLLIPLLPVLYILIQFTRLVVQVSQHRPRMEIDGRLMAKAVLESKRKDAP